MDASTGQVLMEHEGDAQLPIASTTKIMTAILAIERGNLSDVVTVGQKPYDTGGSTIYLDLGERQTLENLLYALMLESANDAAVAIAEHLAGSEERFVAWMNEKARLLGANRTHFANSHGLHDPQHYSTARDLALIARYAMQNETFRRIIAVEEKEIPGAPGQPPRKLVNHNRLLGYYPGANGVKNGFTEEAGLTNVASARRGETELIAVVLGAEWKLWTSSMALLDFGFERYETRRAAYKGLLLEPMGEIEPQVGEELLVTVERGSAPLTRRVVALPDLKPPIAAGQQVGWLVISQGAKELGRVPVVAAGAATARTPHPAAKPRSLSPDAEPGPPDGPGRMILKLIAWLGGSLALTLSLNRAKGGVSRGAA
jgi:D-alanyl-D-alanine carboxypeptidase (penicillin-binding protein 5/6)